MKRNQIFFLALTFLIISAFLIINLFFYRIYNFRGQTMAKTISDNSYIVVEKTNKVSNNDIIYFLDTENKKQLKRNVAGPGDKILIKNSQLYVNNKLILYNNELNSYRIISYNNIITSNIINEYDTSSSNSTNSFILNLTNKQEAKMKVDKGIFISRNTLPTELADTLIFPHSHKFRWNKNNFGTVTVPKKFMKIELTTKNIKLYRYIIEKFEKSKLRVSDNKTFIDNVEQKEYIFKNNYYFVLNDNREIINDSRVFGFIPEFNIRGKAIQILYTTVNNKKAYFQPL